MQSLEPHRPQKSMRLFGATPSAGTISSMDREHTLSDLIGQLAGCLSELDKLGAVVAAAHLSACLDSLGELECADSQLSESE
jgi:DNA-binding FrmR family transcriptional regulator